MDRFGTKTRLITAVVVGLAGSLGAQPNGSDAVVDAGTRPPLPATGVHQPALADLDAAIGRFMQARDIPGGALAVTYKGRLVYDRGHGFADRHNRVPVTPDSRFRIASVSKPFTAVAIMRLVEAKRLKLDDPVMSILELEPFGEREVDEKFRRVTIRHLLQHRGGWDRKASFDPMFRSHVIAAEAQNPGPAAPQDVIRYMAGRGIDWPPGKFYAYSNFGYCLLGRVIEKITGETYDHYMQRHVLRPLGIERMQLGASLRSRRLADEVVYHGQDWRKARSVFAPDEGLTVPWPYGGFHLEAMDSHGAWVASARDLVRFARDFDDPQQSRLLAPESVAEMFARPPGIAGYGDDGAPRPRYYAAGWMVQGSGDAGTQEHGGSLPGTTSKLVRRADGICWAALFNTRLDARGRRIHPDDVQEAVQQALDRVASWPTGDLFDGAR
jgi:N-acyl-D-amino-acid deacylase